MLKAAAVREGYSAIVEYCSFHLAGQMGHDTYQLISNSFPPEILLGEWFFADDLFGDGIPAEDEYIERILAPQTPLQTIDNIRKARRSRVDDERADQDVQRWVWRLLPAHISSS